MLSPMEVIPMSHKGKTVKGIDFHVNLDISSLERPNPGFKSFGLHQFTQIF